MSAPAVSVEHLSVTYGAVRAVDDVSFAVAEGEHVTLLGPSGCGKTTTLRAIAGLEQPSGGRIAMAGRPVFGEGTNLPPERRGISMVFQSYAIWPHMTVAENVAFPLRARGVARRAAADAVRRALALVDLDGFADRPATRLSGGQQQRVALARALAFETRVVLFDEPLSNLDHQLRLQMRGELAALRRRLGFAAIYVTHDHDEALSLSDRIVLMRAGRIEQADTPAALHAAPCSRFAASFMGMRNILDATLEGGHARLADGSMLRVDPAEPPGAAAIAFRPSEVVLADTGNRATIALALFGGERVALTLRAGPLDIHAETAPRPGLHEGAEIHWQVAPGACRVLRR